MPASGQRWRLALAVTVLAAGLALIAKAVIAPHAVWRPWAPAEDGSWAAVSIDSKQVSPEDYRLHLFDGKVAGGRDGCNDWAYTDEPPDASGERTIQQTMAYCPEDDPVRMAYRLLVRDGKIERVSDNILRLVGHGHQGVFRRCEWQTLREGAPGASFSKRECVPV